MTTPNRPVIEVRDVVGQARDHVGGLAPREQEHVLVGCERAVLGGFDRRDDRLLVDVGGDGEGVDAELPQQQEACG